MNEDKKPLHEYSGGLITELPDTKVPSFLKWTYVLMPLIGLFALYQYWNGSEGVLDPGHWHELQQAARTTTPFQKPLSLEEQAYIKSIQTDPK